MMILSKVIGSEATYISRMIGISTEGIIGMNFLQMYLILMFAKLAAVKCWKARVAA
jgi:hypothetical protein